MWNPRLHDVSRQALPPVSAEPPAQDLLRRLVLQTANGTASLVAYASERHTAEVMFEVEVDGVHYLLLRSSPPTLPHLALLSRREAEVARLVAAGYSNKKIAAVLDISPWTVGTYIRRIFAKIGVSCRAAMVARLLAEETSNDRPRSLTE